MNAAIVDPEAAAIEPRSEQVRALRAHVAVFVVGMLGMFAVNLMTNLAAGIADEWSAWWSAWAAVGWSIGLGVHGLVVRLQASADAGGRQR